MKNSMAILAAGVAALMLGVEAQQGPQPQRPPQQQGGQQQRPVTMRRGSSMGERTRRGVDRDSKLGKEDQRLIESIEEAESLSSLRRYIQQAMNSRSPLSRCSAVTPQMRPSPWISRTVMRQRSGMEKASIQRR